jgi:hypothetical protein
MPKKTQIIVKSSILCTNTSHFTGILFTRFFLITWLTGQLSLYLRVTFLGITRFELQTKQLVLANSTVKTLFLGEVRHINIYIIFSVFTSRPISLLSSIRASVFLFIVFMLSPNRFTSSVQTRSWCFPFNFSPIWFSWTRITKATRNETLRLSANGPGCNCHIKGLFFCLDA